MNFENKKILVTGAGRGIGRAVAVELSKRGCTVYALSRTKVHLDTLVEECPSVVPICVDISKWDDTRAALENIEVLDGLVNNAGILPPRCPGLDIAKEDIENVMDVNLYSAINCIQVIGQKMKARGKGGSIVNVSSCASITPGVNLLSYTLSKAGMDLITKQFALELGPSNIRVNAISPTLVLTDMAKTVLATMPHVEHCVLSRTPLERLPEVDEVVGPILYFLSDLSTAVSGTIHAIDGARTCTFKY